MIVSKSVKAYSELRNIAKSRGDRNRVKYERPFRHKSKHTFALLTTARELAVATRKGPYMIK